MEHYFHIYWVDSGHCCHLQGGRRLYYWIADRPNSAAEHSELYTWNSLCLFCDRYAFIWDCIGEDAALPVHRDRLHTSYSSHHFSIHPICWKYATFCIFFLLCMFDWLASPPMLPSVLKLIIIFRFWLFHHRGLATLYDVTNIWNWENPGRKINSGTFRWNPIKWSSAHRFIPRLAIKCAQYSVWALYELSFVNEERYIIILPIEVRKWEN